MYEPLILFFIGIFSSMFGTLVGGAAFITIPVMTALGIPLTLAISSNAFGNMGLNLGGFVRLKRNNLVHFKTGFLLAFFAFIGSIFGSYLVINTPEVIIKIVFGLALISILLSSFIKPQIGLTQNLSRNLQKRNILLGAVLALLLGAYSGFLGAGVGTFYTYGLALIFGHSFLQSTATKKIPGLFQAIGSWLTFSLVGKMNYFVAFPLFLGMYLGSEIGVYFGVKWGNKFIKILLFIIVTVLLIRFIF